MPKYAKTLNEIIKKKSIELKLLRNLKAVDISKREATFELIGMDNKPTGEIEVQKVIIHFLNFNENGVFFFACIYLLHLQSARILLFEENWG